MRRPETSPFAWLLQIPCPADDQGTGREISIELSRLADAEQMTMRDARFDFRIGPGHHNGADVIEQDLGSRDVFAEFNLIALEGALSKSRLCRFRRLDKRAESGPFDGHHFIQPGRSRREGLDGRHNKGERSGGC